MAGMRDSHRLFLQTFMSKGVLNAGEVKTWYKYACQRFGDSGDDQHLAEFVNTINMNIKPIHMEIKKGIHEDSGSHCYVMVNTSDSEITRMASDYSANELAYFKKLMEKIVESETGSMSSTEALNLTVTLEKRMTMEEAQGLHSRLVQDKWIDIDERFDISLTTRSIVELDQYIKTAFPDQPLTCQICHRICIKGQLCGRCDCKLHLHCAARLFQGQNNPKCPEKNCNTPWPHDIAASVRARDAANQLAVPSGGTVSSQASQEAPSTRKRKH